MTFLLWLTVALSSWSMPVEPVTVVESACPAYQVPANCYVADTNTIYLLNRERPYLAHEEGHAVEWRLTPRDHARFLRLAGFKSSTAWTWPDGDAASPSEMFADAYASCVIGHTWGWWYERARSYRPVCSLIRRTVS